MSAGIVLDHRLFYLEGYFARMIKYRLIGGNNSELDSSLERDSFRSIDCTRMVFIIL